MSTDGIAPFARITLRPLGSPLPLGLLALVPAGVLLALLQLGAYPQSEGRTVAMLVLAFVVPLQLITCIFAFLARDTVAATALGLFAGTWLANSVAMLSSPPGSTSVALGTFLLCIGGAFVVILTGASFGKLGPALVMFFGAGRFILAGLYELTGSAGLEHAGAIVGLVLAGTALYSALATEIEDVQGETKLPLLRRNLAAAAIDAPFETQLTRIEHEAGVRQQL